MANTNKPCLPCEAAARNRMHVPQAILDSHALEHQAMRRAGVGAQIWSIGSTDADAAYCRQRRYAIGGAIGIVALWGAAFWWLTR